MSDAQEVIRIAAEALSQDGENGEYDRACAEIVTEFLGLPMDCKDQVLTLLRDKAAWA